MRGIVIVAGFAALALAVPECFTVKKSTGNALCWDHSTGADGVLRVNISCGVDGKNGAPSFCAVGVHKDGDASTKMAPAEVFWVTKVGGKVGIEDRFDASGHAEPVCAPKQVSYDISSSAAADGSFWVAFSRNLNATGNDVYPLTPGSTHNLIAAWGTGGPATPGVCATGYPKHKGDWKSIVTF